MPGKFSALSRRCRLPGLMPSFSPRDRAASPDKKMSLAYPASGRIDSELYSVRPWAFRQKVDRVFSHFRIGSCQKCFASVQTRKVFRCLALLGRELQRGGRQAVQKPPWAADKRTARSSTVGVKWLRDKTRL